MTNKKQKRIIDLVANQPILAVPFDVHRVIGCKYILISGDQICFDNVADYVTIEEARKAINWYVEQLGGRVTWE